MKKYLLHIVVLCFVGVAQAYTPPKGGIEKRETYEFADETTIALTPVKDQGNSGTCSSFSGVGFIESELLRTGKGEFDLSEMWIVRHLYIEKAINYVRMHGKANLSSGGTLNDVLHIVDRYGIVPQEVYSGLKGTQTRHEHTDLEATVKSYVGAFVSNPRKTLPPAWIEGLNGILDSYLGVRPEKFTYKNKEYTPLTFAADLGIRSSDYVLLTAFSHHPLYQPFVLEIPDNWNWTSFYNVTMEELEQVVEHALQNGYTLNWASDVSEMGWAFFQGYALVPITRLDEIPASEREKWQTLTADSIQKRTLQKRGFLPEKTITCAMRQQAFDTYETTDDHGMLLVGLAKDQFGNRFYKVKNSWGKVGLYDGFCYVSAPFLCYKTIGVAVHKEALPPTVREKIALSMDTRDEK